MTLPFKTELKSDSSDDEQRTEKQTTHLANNDKHLLIADDNEINLLLLGVMLDELKCTYDTATNGKEALNLLVNNTYQLALIDLNMPVMNGMELIQALRHKNIDIPAIAVSAFTDVNKISEALSAGYNNYLIKPFDEDQLIQFIDEYF